MLEAENEDFDGRIFLSSHSSTIKISAASLDPQLPFSIRLVKSFITVKSGKTPSQTRSQFHNLSVLGVSLRALSTMHTLMDETFVSYEESKIS